MLDNEIEEMLVKLNCNAPRVTKSSIEKKIKTVDYLTFELCAHKFMICGIKMDNDFVVTSSPITCINADNWRDEIGQELSYQNAFSKLWALEGYRMSCTLKIKDEA